MTVQNRIERQKNTTVPVILLLTIINVCAINFTFTEIKRLQNLYKITNYDTKAKHNRNAKLKYNCSTYLGIAFAFPQSFSTCYGILRIPDLNCAC